MKILCLDQSTQCSGWCVFDGTTILSYGIIECHYENTGARLQYFREEVKKLVRTFHINRIAFENIQYQNNVLTFKSLAEVYGVLEELCWELQLPYTIVPSVSWKSTFGIKGKNRPEQKRNAQEWVLRTYGISAKQDVIDSIVLGSHVLAHGNIVWINTSTTKEKLPQEYEERGAF